MRFPRRAPREVYRLYDEEEYLAGATWEPGVGQEAEAAQISTDSRLRRIVSAAILLGATGAVGGLVVLNSFPQQRWSGRRPGPRMRSATASAARSIASTGPSPAQSDRRVPTRRVPPSWRTGHPRRQPDPRRGVQSVDVAMVASPARVSASAHVASETAHQAEFGFER
jgi:hypothetical protein